MLELLAIVLEAVICVICLRIALQKKRVYGFGLALTFGLYVFFDLARHFKFGVSPGTMDTLFFVATVSALLSIMQLYYRNG